ncbi:hypothetical protein VP01_1243g6, partial [Puccinia sorghi]
KQYLTARGTTTRSHPQYNLSAIQSLSESCVKQPFHMSWPCFLNLLHLIEPDPILYNQSQNPLQDVSIPLAVATCRLGSNSNGSAFFLQRPPLLFQPPQWHPEAATTCLLTCRRPLHHACLPACPCHRTSIPHLPAKTVSHCLLLLAPPRGHLLT